MHHKQIYKFLTDKPPDKTKILIKDEVYPYLNQIALTGKPFGKTKEYIPGFLKQLSQSD